jgi:NAD(P)H-hydrate epimerase
MNQTVEQAIKSIRIAQAGSHKGQNGRLLIIGGSELFHAASLWSLTVASRIVDLVHYSSVPENNELVMRAKEEFRNGIVVSRADIEAYIEEDDCILIGPGMTRDAETKTITHTLLTKYPQKQWVIDAGALQMVDLADIPKGAILTPHHREFSQLCEKASLQGGSDEEKVMAFAHRYGCTVLLKGEKDVASDGKALVVIEGGNVGMTKGGTGDVLAGLIAALACTNNPYTAVLVGSHINKQAGDALHATVGPFFNATDLANQIPQTMNQLLMKG